MNTVIINNKEVKPGSLEHFGSLFAPPTVTRPSPKPNPTWEQRQHVSRECREISKIMDDMDAYRYEADRAAMNGDSDTRVHFARLVLKTQAAYDKRVRALGHFVCHTMPGVSHAGNRDVINQEPSERFAAWNEAVKGVI